MARNMRGNQCKQWVWGPNPNQNVVPLGEPFGLTVISQNHIYKIKVNLRNLWIGMN